MTTLNEEGLKQGIEQGNMSKELELITNMLKKELDYQTISEVTGKTIEEIERIASINI